MKHFEFKLMLTGYGETPEKALEEALLGIALDPPPLDDVEITLEEDAPWMEGEC